MRDQWQVQGLRALEQQIRELETKAAATALRKAGRESMALVQFVMAQGAGFDPTNEGEHMRDAIKLTTKKGKHGNNAFIFSVGPTKQHSQKAIAQEFGTARQQADPFMRPALYDNRHFIVDTFTETLTVALARSLRRQRRRNNR